MPAGQLKLTQNFSHFLSPYHFIKNTLKLYMCFILHTDFRNLYWLLTRAHDQKSTEAFFSLIEDRYNLTFVKKKYPAPLLLLANLNNLNIE